MQAFSCKGGGVKEEHTPFNVLEHNCTYHIQQQDAKSLCLHHQTLPEFMAFKSMSWKGFSGGDPMLSRAGPSTQDVNFLLSQGAKPMVR